MKKFFSGVISLAVALAVLEIISRTAMTFRIDRLQHERKEEPWYVYSPELGWERKPDFNGTYAGIPLRFDSQGFLLGDAEKLANKRAKKILFIGDSNTFGNDSPIEKAFPSLVDSALTDAVTINLAVPGYTSYQGRIVLQRALSMVRPDVIVASFNFNDRRYVLRGSDIDGADMFRRTYEQAKWQDRVQTLEKSYIVRLVRAALRHVGLIQNEVVQPARVDELSSRVSPEAYRKNLTEIAEMARRNDIPLVFLLLRDNPQQVQYLNIGIALLERAQPDSAIQTLTGAARINTLFTALAKLYLRTAYERVGDKERATEAAIIATPHRSLQGGGPIHLDKLYNDIMINVGRQFGASTIDCATELEKTPFVFYDFCHFDTTGHRKIAEMLTPYLRSALSSPFRSSHK